MHSKTTNPYAEHADRQKRVRAAVAAWLQDPTTAADPESAAHRLVDCLLEEDLDLVHRVDSYGRWRVIVDGEPAPFNLNPTSGALDAGDAVEAFLQAVRHDGVDDPPGAVIVVRPATDREQTASLVGDHRLDTPVVKVTPEAWAVLTDRDEDVRLLSATDGRNTVVLRFDRDTMAGFGLALVDEAKRWGEEDAAGNDL